LSSSLLSKNVKIEIYRNIILPVVYGCVTWSLTMRVFEHRELRRIFGSKRNGVKKESGENYVMRSLMISIPHQILFG